MNLTCDFSSRTVLVTGAAQGIGKAIAEYFLAAGARVAAADRDATELEKAWGAPSESVLPVAMDVADPVSVASGVGIIVDTWGTVDVAVNNAGIARDSVVWKLTDEQWKAVLDVHLGGTFNVTRAVVPHMRNAGFGRIVNVTSYTGMHGNVGQANYAAAKGGIIGLSNVAAIEGAEHGVTSNVIVPAALTRLAEGLDTSKYPPMDPELAAPAVGWLAHESCSITGEMLVTIAGRIARAFIAETPGVYRPSWTIAEVGEQIDSIRDTDDPWILPTVSGHVDHIIRSFATATGVDAGAAAQKGSTHVG